MEYDDIIVGAGSAGAVIAARLSEDPARSVLLLEAGPDYTSVEAMPNDLLKPWVSWQDHDWGFRAEAVPGREIRLHRGKVVGGSSAVNGTIALRGVPSDFADWVALGCDEWSYEQVLPYYRRLEADPEGGDFHGASGPVPIERPTREQWQPIQRAFHDACLTAGFPASWDQNLPEETGVGPWPRNRADGNRISTNIAYLLPNRGRLNLTIRSGVLVNRIVFDGKRATGVEVISGGETQRVTGRRITVSAGALQSPAILLRSGVQALAKDGVEHDPSVVTEIGLRYTATGSDQFNDMQVACSTVFDPDQVRGLSELPRAVRSFGVGAVIQRTKGRGRLTLRSTDPAEQPQLDMHYLSHPDDVQRMKEGLRLSWKLMHGPELSPHIGQLIAPTQEVIDDDAKLEEYLRATASTHWHVCGTCRMGQPGDPAAVVDQRGRVLGLESLRIADASVMPDIVSCNTNLTSIMIGERVAEWMQDERP
ncbi:MAG: GMC family oxidoreductase [Dehalococcoidia bacterium]